MQDVFVPVAGVKSRDRENGAVHASPALVSNRPRYASITRSLLLNLVGRSVSDDAALIHDDDTIADRHDDVHIVLDDEHCDAAFDAKLSDVVEKLIGENRRHSGHRLVKQNHARLSHQRPTEFDQLALPAGKGAGESVLKMGKPQGFDCGKRPLAHLALALRPPGRGRRAP